jgi:hypothetical protein
MLRGILVVVVMSALAGPLEAQVRISEIMYHPPDSLLEFIELHNAGATWVSVAGWSFSDGVVWTFPAGSRLEAGAYRLVCRSRAVDRFARSPGLRESRRKYPTGRQVSDEEMKSVNMERNKFHGEWNYVVRPRSNV